MTEKEATSPPHSNVEFIVQRAMMPPASTPAPLVWMVVWSGVADNVRSTVDDGVWTDVQRTIRREL